MEASRDGTNRDRSLLDPSEVNETDHVNNTRDSNKTNFTKFDTDDCVLDNGTSKTKDPPDSNCNSLTKLINNSSVSVPNSVQETQNVETVIANYHLEGNECSIGDKRKLNLPGKGESNVDNRREQPAYPENASGIKEMESDAMNNAGKVLVINSEQPVTKLAASNTTNLEECTSKNFENVINTTTLCSGIVEQFVNQEKIDENTTKDSSNNNNDVEAMITDDLQDDSETSMEKSVNDNISIPDNNSNTVPTCNGDAEQSRDQKESNEAKDTNDVWYMVYPNHPTGNIEPMITDNLEKGKVVNETHSDAENSGKDGIRNASVVEAMNKDQSWKDDKVYQKDLRSLKLLCDYGSDSDGGENEETMKEDDNSNKTVVNIVPVVNPCPAVNQEYREPDVVSVSDSEESDSSGDETSSTSTATSSSSSDETEESEDECVVVKEKIKKEVPKTKGELGLEDLPPIEDLHITVPESECVEIGNVLSIVDSLVVVQSIKGCPALDLDSVLFLDHGHNALGEVFDVFGKVGEACYCVRFNSKDHAVEKGVEVGMPVYYAPRTEYSKYVFLADLTKMKGSDASWAHNNEPPVKFLDYSDDEQERRARKKNKPPVRNVEREETQPQEKRFNRQGGGNGGGYVAPTSPRLNRPWATPFNRYVSNVQSSPPQSPRSSPIPGPKPLIRPSSFMNTDLPPAYSWDNDRSFGALSHRAGPSFQSSMQPPPYRNTGPSQTYFHNNSAMGSRYRHQSPFMSAPLQSHFHNAAAGASPVTGSPQQMLHPQFERDFQYDTNIPPPQPPFSHNQMVPNSTNMNMNDDPYRQTPPTANIMRPTSIPNPGLFAVQPGNGFKVEAPPSLTPYQMPPMRQDFHGSFGGPPASFGGQQPPGFMNPNTPPPPTHRSPPPRHSHTGW